MITINIRRIGIKGIDSTNRLQQVFNWSSLLIHYTSKCRYHRPNDINWTLRAVPTYRVFHMCLNSKILNFMCFMCRPSNTCIHCVYTAHTTQPSIKFKDHYNYKNILRLSSFFVSSKPESTLCFRSIFKESDEMDWGSESELALLLLLALSVLALAADGLRLPLWTDHFIIAAVRCFSRHAFTNPLLIGMAIQPMRRSRLRKTQTR